jgi:hypothetical protein
MQLDELLIRIIFTGYKHCNVPEKNPTTFPEKGR